MLTSIPSCNSAYPVLFNRFIRPSPQQLVHSRRYSCHLTDSINFVKAASLLKFPSHNNNLSVSPPLTITAAAPTASAVTNSKACICRKLRNREFSKSTLCVPASTLLPFPSYSIIAPLSSGAPYRHVNDCFAGPVKSCMTITTAVNTAVSTRTAAIGTVTATASVQLPVLLSLSVRIARLGLAPTSFGLSGVRYAKIATATGESHSENSDIPSAISRLDYLLNKRQQARQKEQDNAISSNEVATSSDEEHRITNGTATRRTSQSLSESGSVSSSTSQVDPLVVNFRPNCQQRDDVGPSASTTYGDLSELDTDHFVHRNAAEKPRRAIMTITSAAARRIKFLLENYHGNKNFAKSEGPSFDNRCQQKEVAEDKNSKFIFNSVRLALKRQGCNGLSYVMTFGDEQPLHQLDEIVHENGATVIIDRKAVMYLVGTEMDYVTTPIASEFVFNNPNKTSQCGCGKSFSVE